MEEKQIKSIDDLVLVHLTNYIPIGGIIRTPKSVGVTTGKTYTGGKKIEVKSKRDTIHFAINGEVTSHEFGDWSKMKYAIIIPLKNMPKDKIFGGSTVDLFTNGDVEIPDGSYILCSEKEQEALQQEVGENIEVKGIDNEYVNGYANEFIQELGYKVEEIGKVSWVDEKDSTIAYHILLENGWEWSTHWGSKKMRDELMFEDIDATMQIIEIMKEKKLSNSSFEEILNKHSHMACTAKLFEDSKYIEVFCERMKEIGIPIPDSIIEECSDILEGKLTYEEILEICKDYYKVRSIPKEYISKYYDYAAEEIFRKRVIGEIRLSQIKDNINENEEIKFKDLVELFDDVLYESTTEERRRDFLKSKGIELSDVEMKILGNQELGNKYLEIERIKDIPYGELSEEDRMEFWEFVGFYKESFEQLIATEEINTDRDGNLIFNGAIRKRKGERFTQEEIELLMHGGNFARNQSDLIIVLKNITLDNNTSLAQYVENCEQMISEVSEILNPKTVSTEELGEQTSEEQNDSIGKSNMEGILAQKMKEYAIARGEGDER